MFSFKVTVKGTANMWTDEPYELIRSKVYEGVIDFQEFKYQVMRFTNDCSDNLNLILQSSNKVRDVKGINFIISISNSKEPNTGKLEYWVSDYNLKRYLDGNNSGPQIDVDVEKQCKDKVKDKLLEKVTNCYITVHDIKYTSTITINIVPYFDHVLNKDYNGEYFVSFSNWVLTIFDINAYIERELNVYYTSRKQYKAYSNRLSKIYELQHWSSKYLLNKTYGKMGTL